MSQRYKREDLKKQLNTIFQIHFTPDMVLDAELISVSEVTEMGPYESFVLTFLVPAECPIQQQIYQLDHPEMGEMELFLVPSGKDDKGTTYASVFNYQKQ